VRLAPRPWRLHGPPRRQCACSVGDTIAKARSCREGAGRNAAGGRARGKEEGEGGLPIGNRPTRKTEKNFALAGALLVFPSRAPRARRLPRRPPPTPLCARTRAAGGHGRADGLHCGVRCVGLLLCWSFGEKGRFVGRAGRTRPRLDRRTKQKKKALPITAAAPHPHKPTSRLPVHALGRGHSPAAQPLAAVAAAGADRTPHTACAHAANHAPPLGVLPPPWPPSRRRPTRPARPSRPCPRST
jgi:hypothetical protein